jgi:hypothetical protein
MVHICTISLNEWFSTNAHMIREFRISGKHRVCIRVFWNTESEFVGNFSALMQLAVLSPQLPFKERLLSLSQRSSLKVKSQKLHVPINEICYAILTLMTRTFLWRPPQIIIASHALSQVKSWYSFILVTESTTGVCIMRLDGLS